MPITRTSADFHRPLRCGDAIAVQLTPSQTGDDRFEIHYQVVTADGKLAAIAKTHHVCIDSATRQRRALTPELVDWLQQWPPAESSPTAAGRDD